MGGAGCTTLPTEPPPNWNANAVGHAGEMRIAANAQKCGPLHQPLRLALNAKDFTLERIPLETFRYKFLFRVRWLDVYVAESIQKERRIRLLDPVTFVRNRPGSRFQRSLH